MSSLHRAVVALVALTALVLAAPPRASAQIAVSANDNKVVNDNGVVKVVPNAPPDTVSVIDLKASPPRVKRALVSRRDDNRVSLLSISGSTVEYTKRDVAAGVRPIVLDIAPNGAFAVVGTLAGAATGDADSVSLIDLTATPPRVVDTIGVLGATAEGLKISPDSSVVAVVVHNGSNRPKDSPFYNSAGKLVMVRVAGTRLSRVAEAPIGRWSQGAAFSPDGRRILVGNMIEKDYWVFQWDGSTLKDTGQRVGVNGGPVAIRTAER